jgi:transposase
MKIVDNNESFFTDEQLKNMSPKHLIELLTIQKKHSESLVNKVKLYEEKLQHLEFINALLTEKLTLSQRRRFGSSSEKYADGYEQANLFNEAEENADIKAQEPQYEEIHPSSYKRKKQKGKKENDLSKFPVVRIEHKLSEEELLCQECNKLLKVMTTETTRYLRFIPARFETVEEVVYVYGCPECGVVKRAPKESSLLKSSIATPSLVAGIMNGKYVNSIPLNRQEQEFKRYDLNLSTRTMSNWMIRCAEDYLYLVYERMKSAMLQGNYIHCDETRIQVLGEPNQKAETKNWMWVYMTDELSGSPLMSIYQYERTRAGYHPKEFLKDYHGYLTADGYSAYHGLSENIIVTGCMAHSRRRFEECITILKKHFTPEQIKSTIAHEAMTRIGRLYKIEEQLKDKSHEERYNERQKQSKPILDAYFTWLHTMDTPDLDRKSKIGDAILYALNQEKYLCRYIDDGHLSIDNNACERTLKTFCIGRRNWLFSKSIEGAKASAIIYSITESAKLNGLRPYFYLEYLLDTMRKHQKDTDYSFIDELLPWSLSLPDYCRVEIKS